MESLWNNATLNNLNLVGNNISDMSIQEEIELLNRWNIWGALSPDTFE